MATFCTIVTPSTAASAQVLAASIRTHELSARVIARLREPASGAAVWDHVVAAAAGDTPPEVLRTALDGAGAAVYVAPEVRLYAALEPLWHALRDHEVVVFRRAVALPDDAKLPDDAALLRDGRVSTAMVAVRDTPGARRFLDWWMRRVAEEARTPWLDLALERFEEVGECRDPGCAVSFWNLHERRLHGDADSPLVDSEPLRFVDYAGFRPDRPYWLSDAGTRVLVVDNPVLSELCGAHADALRGAGWAPPRRDLAGAARLGNSQRVDHLVRVLWERAVAAGEDFGDPLSEAPADAFVEWMRGAAERGGTAGVNRYLFAAYGTRPDLQEAFPDLDGADGEKLVAWAWEHGRREVIGELLPPVPDLARFASPSHLGVNVIGYLGETLGLAEAARLYVSGLMAAGVPVSTTAVTPDLPVDDSAATIERYGSGSYADLRAEDEPVFNLACLNGDHLAELLRTQGDGILGGRPTIGQWGWETDVLPPSWIPAFDVVDEVWVYSRFMAENLGRLVPMPVVVVPPAVVAPEFSRDALTIARDDRFTFLFMLDLFSTLRRKNPLGLVEAFIRAFAAGEGPRLIVKTINARFRPQAAEELRYAAGGHPDVEFVDEYLEPAQKAALLARADCYVSLHRSEGFGLPLAEAMALGTPVIATGYSGNTDFATPFNSYLVDSTPTDVGPDCEIYPPHGTWADPDLDHAAELMRRVWQRPDEAAGRARRAQAEIHRDYAPQVVGRIARARLERLSDLRAAAAGNARSTGGAGTALTRAEHAMAFDLRDGVSPAPAGIAGLARRLVLRAILPFTHHEREVDRALLAALRELHDDVDRAGSPRR